MRSLALLMKACRYVSTLKLILVTVEGRHFAGEALPLADAKDELITRLALAHGVSRHEGPVVKNALRERLS